MMMSDVDDDFMRPPTADRLEDLGGLSHTPVDAGGLTHSMFHQSQSRAIE